MSASDFPLIRIFEWDTAEQSSPVGLRHIPGGSPAFRQMVASGCSTASAENPGGTSGTLLFQDTKFIIVDSTPPSHLESKVTAITFNVANSGVAASDLRLYLVDDSVFQASRDQGLDPGFVQMVGSGNFWAYNGLLPSGAVDQLTTSIPVFPNVFRQDGTAGLVKADDANSSEFIYLNVVLPFGSPLGTFGVCGSGLLRFGLIFNYWCSDFFLNF